MNRQQFLKILFLGGAGLVAYPLLPKSEKDCSCQLCVRLNEILGNGQGLVQNHKHNGIDADGLRMHREYIGYSGLPEKDFVEIRP